MKTNLIHSKRSRRGQGMTEYIIIVALIAIAAIGAITVFSDDIRALFGVSTDALAGQTDVNTRAVKSQTKFEKKKLENFGNNNY